MDFSRFSPAPDIIAACAGRILAASGSGAAMVREEVHGAKKGVGLSPGAPEPVRRLCARRNEPPRVSRSRPEVRHPRRQRGGAVRDAEAQLRLGDPGSARRQPHRRQVRHHSLPGGRRRHQGLSGPARQFRQIAGGAGCARKSRLEPVYRRRGPAPGCRQFHRLRPRRADLGRRLSRRRRERAPSSSAGSIRSRCRRISPPRRGG